MKLKELSDLLGLSPTTVSRALNGYPEVSEATRERVMRVAAKQNYRPNRRAMGLATGRAMAIGHIIPVSSKHELVNPVFAEFIAGASQTYNGQGYELMLSFADSEDEAEIYRSVVAKGAVDGVILHSPKREDPRVNLLQEIGIPFVIHGRVSERVQDYSWIDVNNRSAFYQATRLLLDLGHRRIALINGLETLDFAWNRRKGYEQALHEAGIELDPTLLGTAGLTETHGYTSTARLLEMENPPTALLASSYVVGLGASRAIREAGLTMGKEVSVIIHDDELSYFHNVGDVPLFTSTRSSVREAGIKAAQMLLELIEGKTTGPVSQLLESHLTIGSSTGPCTLREKIT
ncbi:MAG: substrate-binding domain-containing protein [Granulosicoccus sp.]|nr:substrate-binding domain-containing protein [Granulosicoccus sp.]